LQAVDFETESLSKLGFSATRKMAPHGAVRRMLVSGPLEYIIDAPKAHALARKRLSAVAQGYMESLCE